MVWNPHPLRQCFWNRSKVAWHESPTWNTGMGHFHPPPGIPGDARDFSSKEKWRFSKSPSRARKHSFYAIFFCVVSRLSGLLHEWLFSVAAMVSVHNEWIVKIKMFARLWGKVVVAKKKEKRPFSNLSQKQVGVAGLESASKNSTVEMRYPFFFFEPTL